MKPITLAEMLDGNVEIVVNDAVAIAQQLICADDIHWRAEAPYGPPTLNSVAVTADGTVQCLHTAATPSVTEVALLLQTLVGHSSEHVPGGLRYAIGRALLEVEAPPFDSAEDFASALGRFESGDRRERVARVFERARAALSSDVAAALSPAAAPARTERRVHQPSASELRRQLREADLKLYEAHRLDTHDHHVVRRRRVRRSPVAACMVAGVALVAAGEFAYVGQHSRPVLPAISQTPAVIQAQPAEPQDLTGSNVRPSSQPGKPLPRTTSPPRIRTTAVNSRTAGAVGTQARRGRTGASDRAQARPGPRAPQKGVARRTPEREQSDRGVLARIRFEWNNPFR